MKDAIWAAHQIRKILLKDHRTISTEEMQAIEEIIQEAIREAQETGLSRVSNVHFC